MRRAIPVAVVLALGGLSAGAVIERAQALETRSDVGKSWGRGSATWTAWYDGDAKTRKPGYIKYSESVQDLTCKSDSKSGSNVTLQIRVWYTDRSSQYGGAVTTDTNGCDASYGPVVNATFRGKAGKEIAYFTTVLRDSVNTDGVLGSIANN